MLSLLFLVLAFGCSTRQVKKTEEPKAAVISEDEKKREAEKAAGIPQDLETLVVKKGGIFQAFVGAGQKLTAAAPQDKTWVPVYLRPKETLNFYARLKPEAGAKLGNYATIFLVLATYNDPSGFQNRATVLVQMGIVRDGKEDLFYQGTLLPQGQSYARYPLTNRELSAETEVKEGDLFLLRVVHRKGPGGAVAFGGGLGSASSQVILSGTELGDGYIQYDKK
jgi:hypothetical protein